MLHIIERFFIHFAASTFLTLGVFFLLRYWLRRNAKVARWVSGKKAHLLVTAALVVFALAPIREAYDVAFGTQVWYKAITDQLSWLVGPAVAVLGLYRFSKTGDIDGT